MVIFDNMRITTRKSKSTDAVILVYFEVTFKCNFDKKVRVPESVITKNTKIMDDYILKTYGDDYNITIFPPENRGVDPDWSKKFYTHQRVYDFVKK